MNFWSETLLFHRIQTWIIPPDHEVGLYIFLRIDLTANHAGVHSERIGDFLRRRAIANAIDDERSGDAGILVIIHLHNIEFSCSKIIGKRLREPHVPRAIEDVHLNPLTFANEHIWPIQFPADRVSEHGPVHKLPAQ